MEIFVSAGSGRGPTPLAAFDAALNDAGIANYNLIVLSSVIPPQARVCVEPFPSEEAGWGQRLYVVMAEKREVVPGREAWAGVGWTQQSDGRGLFVEHYGSSQAEVEQAIQATLADMVERRPGLWTEPRWVTRGVRCGESPVCALVAAVYTAEPW